MTAGRIDSAHTLPKVTSEILDRLPPQNLDAERGVLGSILLNPHVSDDVVLILRPEDFYAEAHRRLYGHMVSMHDQGQRIDAVLLWERLKQSGELEAVGGSAYLMEISQSVPVAAHAVYYARIVRDKATLREIIHASTEILRDAYDPTLEPREMLGQAEEKIFAIHDRRSSDQVSTIHDVLLQAFAQIDQRLEHGGATGVPSGYIDLDNLTGGFHESELIILAARPSMGKTALALNIADHAAMKAGAATLIVSLEMSRLELAQRMLCAGKNQRTKVPRRFPFRRREKEARRNLGGPQQSTAFYRRHSQPNDYGDFGLRSPAETQSQLGIGGHRLSAAH